MGASVPLSRIWFASAISLTGFSFETRLGGFGIAICLLPWLVVALAWPKRAFAAINHPIAWMLPAMALLSSVWSIEPALTLRLGFELAVFTGVALIHAHALNARSVLAALLCALSIAVAAGLLFNRPAVIWTTGEVAMTGIFNSKNNFANFTCLLLLTATAVTVDPRQPRALRLLGVAAIVAAPIVLLKAHSLGALIAGGFSLVSLGSIVALKTLSGRARGPALIMIVILLALVALVLKLAVASGLDASSLLQSLGKDASLTGRTFLWSRATDYIAERPLGGVGYQAFWVQGHVEAEGLWRYAHIDSRTGFHFHNLFYETAVELGACGVVALGGFLASTVIVCAIAAARRPGAETGFYLALMIYFLFRIPVELDFLDPFSPGSLLLPLAWVHATQPQGFTTFPLERCKQQSTLGAPTPGMRPVAA